MKESDILHENGPYWVGKTPRGTFTVYVSGITHSVSDSTYGDKSLAIARCDYFGKRPDLASQRFEALSKTMRREG